MGKTEETDFVLKVRGLWILEGTMFNVFISFKVFMNQESPSKKCFQFFIKNTSKRFLEKMNFSATLPKIYFYNNSPNSFFKCPHNIYYYLLYEKHFDNLFWNFQWESSTWNTPVYVIFCRRLRTVNAHIRTPHLTINITRLL